jgi:hypothetical protein
VVEVLAVRYGEFISKFRADAKQAAEALLEEDFSEKEVNIIQDVRPSGFFGAWG